MSALVLPGAADFDVAKARTFHHQREEVRRSSKTTVDHQDGMRVAVREHWDETVGVKAMLDPVHLGGVVHRITKGQAIVEFEPVRHPHAQLFGRFAYCNHRGDVRVIDPNEGWDALLIGGGTANPSGLFAQNWLNSLGGTDPTFNLNTPHQRAAMFTNSVAMSAYPASGTSPNTYDDTTSSDAQYGIRYGNGVWAANEIPNSGNYLTGGAGDSIGGSPAISWVGSLSPDAAATWQNTANGVLEFTTPSATWPSSVISSAQGVLLYINATVGAMVKPAYAFLNFGSAYSTAGQSFIIQPNSNGLFTWTTR